MKVYRVTLSGEERAELERMTRTGKAAALKLTGARIPLLADGAPGGPGRSGGQIIEAWGVSKNTVCRVRERFVGRGLASARVREPAARACARKPDGGARPTGSRWPAPTRRPGGRMGRRPCWPTG